MSNETSITTNKTEMKA